MNTLLAARACGGAALRQGLLGVLLGSLALPVAEGAPFEHREFDATLQAPYRAQPAERHSQARTFVLRFDYPAVLQEQAVTWRLDLLTPSGRLLQRWFGIERLYREAVTVHIPWGGRSSRATVPDGIYHLRLRALAQDAGPPADAAEFASTEQTLAAHVSELVEQDWDIAVGEPAPPAMPAFHALPRASARGSATADTLPYTVYYGNLHSQTNHSDGGGELATCHGAQPPQSAPYGPDYAYAYARGHGLDILMTSEHNHMYDGSDGTNGAADTAVAKALYQAGLASAAAFNASHPDFLAIYGQEWGVIANGGHLNIFNSAELLGWEYNDQQQLLADTFTPRSDYATLFGLMRQRGWVGQFNHPALAGQFLIGGQPFGYSADGDQVMALCEVMNSSAFSNNDTETEAHRSNYELACDKALEAGYHLAFSSDQDNHCANWGASYGNRTGVLIATGALLSADSFLEALRARRVFATMDKHAQLVLTANGHLMGERFSNSGALHLVANFASASGRSVAAAVVYEGVPGRNGTVSALSNEADTVITPADGEHFYYVKLTEDDGNVLWSAPVWVSQVPAAMHPRRH